MRSYAMLRGFRLLSLFMWPIVITIFVALLDGPESAAYPLWRLVAHSLILAGGWVGIWHWFTARIRQKERADLQQIENLSADDLGTSRRKIGNVEVYDVSQIARTVRSHRVLHFCCWILVLATMTSPKLDSVPAVDPERSATIDSLVQEKWAFVMLGLVPFAVLWALTTAGRSGACRVLAVLCFASGPAICIWVVPALSTEYGRLPIESRALASRLEELIGRVGLVGVWLLVTGYFAWRHSGNLRTQKRLLPAHRRGHWKMTLRHAIQEGKWREIPTRRTAIGMMLATVRALTYFLGFVLWFMVFTRGGILYVPFALLFLWIGANARNWGLRFSAMSLAIPKDASSTILLLRSFQDDHLKPARGLSIFGAAPFEELVTLSFWPVGPLRAIGRPRQLLKPTTWLAPFGAVREYVGADWEAKVLLLIPECARIIVLMGTTEGISKELKMVLEPQSRELLRKSIILFPPLRSTERHKERCRVLIDKLGQLVDRDVQTSLSTLLDDGTMNTARALQFDSKGGMIVVKADRADVEGCRQALRVSRILTSPSEPGTAQSDRAAVALPFTKMMLTTAALTVAFSLFAWWMQWIGREAELRNEYRVASEKGEDRFSKREFRAALKDFERALAVTDAQLNLDPKGKPAQRNRMEAHYSIGQTYIKLIEYDKALGAFKSALDLFDTMKAEGTEINFERALVEERITYCELAPLATGDWDALVKSDAKTLPQLLSIRLTEFARQGRIADLAQAGKNLSLWAEGGANGTPGDQRAGMLYDAACAYSLCAGLVRKNRSEPTELEQEKETEYRNLALDCLRKALAAGYSDFDHMRKDSDLDPLRGVPEFEALFPK